jgi:hypothetical protein
VSYSSTRIVTPSASALFSGVDGAEAPLPKDVRSMQISLALQINELMAIAISGNPWSNTGLERRVAVELNLLKP